MFEVRVESSFKASHAVRLPGGEMEPLHEHDWRVEAIFCGPDLDGGGVLLDFTIVQQALNEIIEPLYGANLNQHSFLQGKPSSAELVARRIFELLNTRDWPGAVLTKVVVKEGPGCEAAFGTTAGRPTSNCQKD